MTKILFDEKFCPIKILSNNVIVCFSSDWLSRDVYCIKCCFKRSKEHFNITCLVSYSGFDQFMSYIAAILSFFTDAFDARRRLILSLLLHLKHCNLVFWDVHHYKKVQLYQRNILEEFLLLHDYFFVSIFHTLPSLIVGGI